MMGSGDPPAPVLAPPPSTSGGNAKVGSGSKACVASTLADLTVTVLRKTSKKPVKGAKVEISGPTKRSGTTKANGEVLFRGIKTGTYSVTASKEKLAKDKRDGVEVKCLVPNKAELQLPDPVTPIITPDDITVVVKKPYTTVTRSEITLKTDFPFDGSGTLTCTTDSILFFDDPVKEGAVAGGLELEGAELTKGRKVYLEGKKPSAKAKDIKLTLELTSDKVPVEKPATATVTCVEATLDICGPRTQKGKDPTPLAQPPDKAPTGDAAAKAADKLYGGGCVHVQDAGNGHARALLIIRKAKPADFKGNLVLDRVNNKVDVFANEEGGTALAIPHTIKNSDIPKNGKNLWVQGAIVSAAARDTGFTLKVEVGTNNVEADKVKATVVEIEITAKVPTTKSARGTNDVAPPSTHHEFKSKSGQLDLTRNNPTVLVRNCEDVELEATVKPAGLPGLAWEAVPNPGPNSPAPTVTPSDLKAKLRTNASGGYAVKAAVRNAGVYWNVVLVEVRIKSSKIRRNSGNFTDRSTPGWLSVSSGVFNVAAPAQCGMYARAKIALYAGGQSSLDSYCDRVHAGIVNVLGSTTAAAAYSGGGRERERIPTVAGLPNPVVDPATVVADLGYPILDRGGPQGTRATGGNTIFLSQTRSTPATGMERLVETCDSPAVGFNALLPVHAPPVGHVPAKCTGNSGVNAFTVFLAAYSDDANYTYVAYGSAGWTADYTGTVAVPAGANPKPVWTKTTAGITGAGTRLAAIANGREAKDAGCEVRPPVYLTYIIDAR